MSKSGLSPTYSNLLTNLLTIFQKKGCLVATQRTGIPLEYPGSPFGYAKGLGRSREGAEYLLLGSWIEVGKRARSNTETNWAL